MKRKTTTIILVIIFLMGFSVLLYPVVSSYVNQMDATKATEQYDELMKKMENKKSESILNEANLYNENLTKDNVEYKNQEENKYADILNVDDSGSMGYISIPKIKVKIPIKHGTTDEVLSLVDKMLELPNPFSCPHGRPTAIKMSKYDIERKFARK